MKRTRFITDGLAVDVFQPDDQSHPELVGMYLYGFPGSIGESAPTKALLENGYTVVQPHYPGTYDSAGLFSATSAIDVLGRVATALRNGCLENVKDRSVLRIGQKVSVCIGHSFGAFAALHGAQFLPDLQTLILLGPAVAYGAAPGGCGLIENGESHVSYVRRSRPFTYRMSGDPEWSALYRGDLDNISGHAPTTLRAVHGIVGEFDKYFDHQFLNNTFAQIVNASLRGKYLCSLESASGIGHGPAGLLDAEKLKILLRR